MSKQLEQPMLCKLMVQLGEDVVEIDGVGASLAIDRVTEGAVAHSNPGYLAGNLLGLEKAAHPPDSLSSFTLTGMILKSKTHSITSGAVDHRAVEGGFEFERDGKTRFVSQDAVARYGMSAAADLAFTLEDGDPAEEAAFVKRRLEQGFSEIAVPEHLKEGIVRYVVGRIPSGDFLAAVFANDLTSAAARADSLSFSALREIVQLISAFTPAACRGSHGKVKAWCNL